MARLIALAVAVLALAGCVPTKVTPGPTLTQTEIRTLTRSPTSAPATYRPPPARSVAPLPPGQAPARGEVEKACPYIASSPADSGAPNVADLIGSHVLRTTVLTTTTPVGCRFYFYAGDFQAIADIVPRRFGTARAAYDAMLATAAAGTSSSGRSDIVPGTDAVVYRTTFYDVDGARDWACVFAAGSTMVVVHSDRDDFSYSVLRLATLIAPKFG